MCCFKKWLGISRYKSEEKTINRWIPPVAAQWRYGRIFNPGFDSLSKFSTSNHPSSPLPISTTLFCFELSSARCRLRVETKMPYYIFAKTWHSNYSKKFAAFRGFTCFLENVMCSLTVLNFLWQRSTFSHFSRMFMQKCSDNFYTFSFAITNKYFVKTKMDFCKNPKNFLLHFCSGSTETVRGNLYKTLNFCPKLSNNEGNNLMS